MTTDQALVLAGHGSHHEARTAAAVHVHAERVLERGCFDAVRTAFWKEQPSLAEVRSTVDAEAVYVVPFLTSEGYFADRVFPRELGLTGVESTDAGSVTYTEPVGTHERLADVVVDRARGVTDDAAREADVGLVLVGHGTDRHERSAGATVAHADRLRDRGAFPAVEAAFLDQSPDVADVADRIDAEALVVVPLFVSNGHHVTRDIPTALGVPSDGDPFGGPTDVDGKRLWYAEAVGTAPSVTAVVLDRAAEAGADTRPGRPASDAAPSAAGRAFLRWIEGAPRAGVDASERTRQWGELAITVAEDGGDRRFDVRHEIDRAAGDGDLDQLATSAEVRARTGRDTAGNHRPLRTARTLPRGWQFGTRDPRTLVRAVSAVYPASIDHWHHDRTGTLETRAVDVVLDRQIGRYRGLDGLDDRTLSGTVSACCGDCVRRRDWEGPPGDAEPSAGSIPCPEPCSFLLEAARTFATVEPADAEEPHDPTVPPAAFDQPGNRSRVRFLRAVDVGARSLDGPLTHS